MRFTRLLVVIAGPLLMMGLLNGFGSSPDSSGRPLSASAGSSRLVDETLPARGWYKAIAQLPSPRIAFLGSDNNIWLISSAGGDRVRITGSSAVSALAWSPDGTQMAYVSSGDLYVVDLPHENRRKLTHTSDVGPFSLAWSKSGQIAFVRGENSIATISAGDETPKIRTLVKSVPFRGYGLHRPFSFPSLNWSADGSMLTFDVYPSYGFGLASLKVAGYQKTPGWHASWSPTYDELAYVRDGQIRLVDVQQGEESVLIQSPDGTYAFPTFSPDSTRIAYTWSLPSVGADSSLWVYDRLQEKRTKLFPGPAADLSWSPDGRRLAFARWVPAGGFFQFSGISVIDDDGLGLLELTPDGHSPQWQPNK